MYHSFYACLRLPLYLLLAMLCTSSAWAASRCTERSETWWQSGKISCSYQSTWISSGVLSSRKVIYQTPLGTPPAAGWPVVIIYQGSFFPLDDFTYYSDEALGRLYNEGRLIQRLLDNGYAVIAPSAPADLFWQTNIPGLAQAYDLGTDYQFISNILAGISLGHFGPLDRKRQYATGISSGGYNTSRMAVSFPNQFKALAIQSGSYATCSGPICVVPSLPSNHPPTTFVHGFLDITVPWWSMDLYYDRLLYQGIETTRYTEPTGAHEWFSASPGHILAWFNAHP